MTALARRLPPIQPPKPHNPCDLAAAVAALVKLGMAGIARGMAVQQLAAQQPNWLTLSEASKHSGLSIAFLRRLIASKKLKAIRDRAVKVSRRDLDNLDHLADLAESSARLSAAADALRATVCGRRRG